MNKTACNVCQGSCNLTIENILEKMEKNEPLCKVEIDLFNRTYGQAREYLKQEPSRFPAWLAETLLGCFLLTLMRKALDRDKFLVVKTFVEFQKSRECKNG